jgi:hypothetical protein
LYVSVCACAVDGAANAAAHSTSSATARRRISPVIELSLSLAGFG